MSISREVFGKGNIFWLETKFLDVPFLKNVTYIFIIDVIRGISKLQKLRPIFFLEVEYFNYLEKIFDSLASVFYLIGNFIFCLILSFSKARKIIWGYKTSFPEETS